MVRELQVSDGQWVSGQHLPHHLGRLGRKAGLFNQLPFSTYFGLLMGIVIKKHSDSVKYGIIHDLSWPPGDCVNDHINPDLYHCIYASFDQAISLIKKQGVGALVAKLDLADAFKHILVIPRTGHSYTVHGIPPRQMAQSLGTTTSTCSCPSVYAPALLYLTIMLMSWSLPCGQTVSMICSTTSMIILWQPRWHR